ncbi:MAG: GAF domain-containing protein [Deltaproteobacteria bacterium]|nr:GAF domain-containing protein [Deltaproteobacteria bacterium]
MADRTKRVAKLSLHRSAKDPLRRARLRETEPTRELASLHAIAAAVSGSLDLNQVLAKALDTILDVTDMEAGFIRFPEGEPPQLTLKVHKGISPAFVKKLQRGFRSGGKSEEVFSTKQSFVFDTPTQHTGTLRPEATIREGFTAGAWVPITSKEKVVGIISVRTRKVETFPREQIPLLESIGASLGVALENARLFEEAKKNTFELEEANREIGKANLRLTHLLEEQRALREILTQINLVDMGELLKKIAEHSLNLLKADHVQIRLLDKDGLLRLVAIAGEGAERFQDGLKLGSGRSTWVMENRRPLAIKDISQDKVFGPGHFLRELGVKGYLLLPLISREQKPIGVLGVSTLTEREFTQEEIALAEQFAAGAAIAIENARLYEETQKREDIQKLLKELSQDITSLDIDSLLKKLTDKVRDVVKVDMCDVRVNEKGIWQILGVSGIEAERVRSGATGTARGRSSWIIKNRKVLSIPDITKGTDTPGGESTRRIGVRGYLGVPLFLRGGEVVGVLRAMTYQPRDFSQDEVDLVQQLANGAAIALENARLFQEAEWRAREQAVLNTIAMATSQSLDLNELLQTALDKVLEVTGRDGGYIRLKDSVTGEIILAAHRGISEEYAQALLYRRTPGGKSDQVFESGEPLVVNDPEGANLKEETRREGRSSIGWFPLKARGKVVGILNVSTSQPRSFEPREVELLLAIGHVIGVGLENARLFEEVHRKSRELEALVKINRDVAALLDRETLLPRIAEEARRILKVDVASFRLIEGKTMVRAGYAGKVDLMGLRPMLHLNESITGRIIRKARPIAIQHLQEEPAIIEEHRKLLRKSGYHSFLGVPLLVGGQIIGAINFYSKEEREFHPEEINLITAFADQAAIAVENARLYAQTKEQATQLEKDIIERKQAEEELRRSREQLRHLARHIQSVREVERSSIAREIHDELGQALTGLKMDLSWLRKKLSKDRHSLLVKTKSMLNLIDQTIQTVRKISTELRPGALDELGLAAAIEWQFQEFQNRTGIKGAVRSHLEEIHSDQARSTAVFRIFQEALTNIARHAKATRVNISLQEEGGSMILQVTDNGRGIKESKIFDGKSLGLLGMRERALPLGGEVAISGRRGEGTTVTVRIPLN